MRACTACLSVFASEPEFCVFDGERLGGDEEVLLGRVLGNYRFTGLLGVGATGCVFSGMDIAHHRRVAIKMLYGEMASDPSVAERFRREAEAVRAIDHANVVKVYDTGRSPAGLPYMVMELVDGPTLRALIEEEAPLTQRRVGRIADQLIAGLSEAHRLGFVHRDLKPGNIIVTRDDRGAERVKILDFGIVASLQARTESDRLTRTGYIVGTPTYMAPEQVDPRAVSPQSDVYALGVILYELLAGHAPFFGTLEQILVAKMTTRPPPLPNAGELGSLVLSMMESLPQRRPADARQVRAALSRITALGDDAKTERAGAFAATVEDLQSFDGSVRLFDRTEASPAAEEADADEWGGDTHLNPHPVPELMEGMQTDAVPPVDVNARSEPDTAPQPLNPAAPTAPTEIPPPVRDEAATDAAPVRPRTPSARTRAHTTRPPARRTSLRVQRVHARSLLDAAAVSPDYGDATDVAVTATTDWGSASVDTPVLADTDSAELVPGELEPLPSPWDPPEHTHAVSTARGPAAIARPPSLPASEALTAGLSLAPAPTVPAGPPGRPHLEILSEPSDIALPQGRIFSLDEPGPPPMPLPLPPLVQPAQRIFAARQPMIVREADATTDLEEDPLDSADTAFSVAAGPSRPRRTRGSVARGKPPLPAPVDQGPPAWLLGIALFVLLSLSAMLGFYLATRGETIIVDAPTSMERSPRR